MLAICYFRVSWYSRIRIQLVVISNRKLEPTSLRYLNYTSAKHSKYQRVNSKTQARIAWGLKTRTRVLGGLDWQTKMRGGGMEADSAFLVSSHLRKNKKRKTALTDKIRFWVYLSLWIFAWFPIPRLCATCIFSSSTSLASNNWPRWYDISSRLCGLSYLRAEQARTAVTTV